MTYEIKFPRMHIFAECDADSDLEDYDRVKPLSSEKVMVLQLHNPLFWQCQLLTYALVNYQISEMVEDLRVAIKHNIYKYA